MPFPGYSTKGCSPGHAVAVMGAAVAPDTLPTGNTALIAALGGNSVVPAFYDVRVGVTTATGVSQWDDCRGAVGFGPSLVQATATNQPALTGTGDSDWAIAFDGTNDGLSTPASALFDLSTGKTIAMVATIPAQASTRVANAIRNAGNTQRFNTSISATQVTGSSVDSGGTKNTSSAGAPDGSRWLILTSYDSADDALVCEVPDRTRQSVGNLGDMSSADYILDIGHRAAALFAAIDVRAVVVLEGGYDTDQRDALKAWAIGQHGAEAAS